jgi:hypothetical protein
MRAQPVAEHLFPSADGSLGPGAFRVPGRPLPSHPALLGDELEMAVALRRIALSRLARHCVFRSFRQALRSIPPPIAVSPSPI